MRARKGQKVTRSSLLVLSSGGSEDQTQVVRVSGKHFLPTEPSCWLFYLLFLLRQGLCYLPRLTLNSLCNLGKLSTYQLPT